LVVLAKAINFPKVIVFDSCDILSNVALGPPVLSCCLQ